MLILMSGRFTLFFDNLTLNHHYKITNFKFIFTKMYYIAELYFLFQNTFITLCHNQQHNSIRHES